MPYSLAAKHASQKQEEAMCKYFLTLCYILLTLSSNYITLEDNMSLREKIEWATLVALVSGFGWYFVTIYLASKAAGQSLEHGPGIMASMGLFGVAVAIITIIMVVTSIFFAVRAPDEANARADEREKGFSMRASSFAYFLLLIGNMLLFVAAHIGHGLYFILNLLLAVIFIAEIGRVAFGLWLYRKGS